MSDTQRSKVRVLGFLAKLAVYFTREAFRDFQRQEVPIDEITTGYLVHLESDKIVFSEKGKLTFKEILNNLYPCVPIDQITIDDIHTQYEHIYCVSGIKDDPIIILMKDIPSGDRYFIQSDFSLWENDELQIVIDLPFVEDNSDEDESEEPEFIAKTRIDFRKIQEWFDYNKSLRDELKKKQDQNSAAS